MEHKAFSIDRFNLLCRFYWPAMRRQLLWSGIVLVACYVASLLAVEHINLTSSDGMTSLLMIIVSGAATIISFIYYLGPLLFASCRNRQVATTLPASWQEKAVMLLGWCIVAFPLFMAVVWYACVGVASIFSNYASVYPALVSMVPPFPSEFGINFHEFVARFNYINTLTSLATMSFVALAVSFCRHNRYTLGVVGALVGSFIVGAMSVGLTVIAFLNTDFMRGLRAGLAVNPEDFGHQFFRNLIEYMPVFGWVVAVIPVVVFGLCIYKIKTRQN